MACSASEEHWSRLQCLLLRERGYILRGGMEALR